MQRVGGANATPFAKAADTIMRRPRLVKRSTPCG